MFLKTDTGSGGFLGFWKGKGRKRDGRAHAMRCDGGARSRKIIGLLRAGEPGLGEVAGGEGGWVCEFFFPSL